MRTIALVLLFGACSDDADGDGYDADVDCDDAAFAVHPDAPEACNGVDDDCDGVTDPPGSEGTHAYYADRDADGWGDRTYVVKACSQPIGFVQPYGDCDDLDARINPEADEAPDDGINGDCDTATPE